MSELKIESGFQELSQTVPSASIVAYTDWLRNVHFGIQQHAPVAVKLITQIASLTEIADRLQGTEQRQAGLSSVAFLKGGFLAIRAVELSESAPVLESMHRYTPRVSYRDWEEHDTDARQIIIADRARVLGDEGYAMALPLKDRLDDWGMQVARGNIMDSLCFKRGFGFMLQAAGAVAELCAQQEFENFMLESELDIDAWADLEAEFEAQQ